MQSGLLTARTFPMVSVVSPQEILVLGGSFGGCLGDAYVVNVERQQVRKLHNSRGETQLLEDFCFQAEANQCCFNSRKGEVTGLVNDMRQLHLVTFTRNGENEIDIVTNKIVNQKNIV